ncbi:MAG: very short patch repair endonuclease [Gemmatimonadota bacterium]|nr:very short patch repair endonuclease [Gemmatimonadota bacterium]
MADCFTREKRSAIMRAVRTRDTAPKVRLRKELWAVGLRYRLQYPIEGIRPDIVFVAPRVAVFVDGCFWHGCPVHYQAPRSNVGFCERKLRANRARDRRVYQELGDRGWPVLRFWECEVNERIRRVREQIVAAVRK